MKDKTLVIDHPSQLNSLSVMPLMRTKALGRLILGGNISDHPDKERWEKELNLRYYACGCDTSAIGLIIGLGGGSAFSAYNYFQRGWELGGVISATLLITVLSAGAGKLVGLLKARKKLQDTILEIQGKWVPEPRPVSKDSACG